MIFSILQNWWHGKQLEWALKQGKYNRADYYLKQLESSCDRLPLSASLYQQKLLLEHRLKSSQEKNKLLNQRLKDAVPTGHYLKPDYNFLEQINKSFSLRECDRYKLQVTGVNEPIFQDLEFALANFLETEIENLLHKVALSQRENLLQTAVKDLLGLKKGIDPNYNLPLSPHIYLLKYFIENVYCTYLAWFLVYQAGLLPKNIKLLDVAAGPGTVIYGLGLLLASIRGFSSLPPLHISYYSLEQQAPLQYRGLQFWRSYMESLDSPLNAYFRFNTLNLFEYFSYKEKLPDNFFNLITISHCFFYHPQQRAESFQIYRQIFQHNLTESGYVLLIVQGRKLFNLYDIYPTEDLAEEKNAIAMFLADLGLKLEWYRYLTSTGRRTPLESGFAKFARNNLPTQSRIGRLRQKYLKEPFLANYVIDDYVILAKK